MEIPSAEFSEENVMPSRDEQLNSERQYLTLVCHSPLLIYLIDLLTLYYSHFHSLNSLNVFIY